MFTDKKVQEKMAIIEKIFGGKFAPERMQYFTSKRDVSFASKNLMVLRFDKPLVTVEQEFGVKLHGIGLLPGIKTEVVKYIRELNVKMIAVTEDGKFYISNNNITTMKITGLKKDGFQFKTQYGNTIGIKKDKDQITINVIKPFLELEKTA